MHYVRAKPFLYNVVSVVSSASGEASKSITSPDSAIENIAKPSKQLEDPLNDVNVTDDNNEVAPTIIQKKINKILQKFSYLTRIAGSSSSWTTPSTNDDRFDFENEDFDKEFEDSPKNISIINTFSPSLNKTQDNEVERIIFPAKLYGEPNADNVTEKITIKMKEIKRDHDRNGKIAVFNIRPNNVRDFISDILSAIAGLTNIAATKFRAPIKSTTEGTF